jgi:hypothetical protein
MYEVDYPESEYPAEAAPVADLTMFPEVAELLKRRPDLIATTAKCIICQRRSEMLGVFVVNNKHAAFYGAPPMKERKFLYGLCSPCAESPERVKLLQQIEEMFFKNAGMPVNTIAQ